MLIIYHQVVSTQKVLDRDQRLVFNGERAIYMVIVSFYFNKWFVMIDNAK